MLKDATIEKSIVFVVDDDDALRESLGGLLRSVGLEVRTFASAFVGLLLVVFLSWD